MCHLELVSSDHWTDGYPWSNSLWILFCTIKFITRETRGSYCICKKEEMSCIKTEHCGLRSRKWRITWHSVQKEWAGTRAKSKPKVAVAFRLVLSTAERLHAGWAPAYNPSYLEADWEDLNPRTACAQNSRDPLSQPIMGIMARVCHPSHTRKHACLPSTRSWVQPKPTQKKKKKKKKKDFMC
jgi:hypothetical protein